MLHVLVHGFDQVIPEGVAKEKVETEEWYICPHGHLPIFKKYGSEVIIYHKTIVKNISQERGFRGNSLST